MQRHNQLTFKLLKSGSPDDIEATFLAEDVLGRIEKTEKKHTKIAGFFDGKICATSTLIQEESLFKMLNVAVTPEMQNKGIGSEMLKFCEEFVLEKGIAAIYCHARDYAGKSAVNFFLKNQYFCRGNEFEEGGVSNQLMIKILVE